MRKSTIAAMVLLLAGGISVAQEDKCDKQKCESHDVVIPLKDVKAACCTAAIKKAFSAMASAKSVSVKEYEATVTLKDKRLALSELAKAIDKAQAAMGKSMGLNYALDKEKVTSKCFALKVGDVSTDKKLAEMKEWLSKVEGAGDLKLGKKDSMGVTVILKGSITLADIEKAFKDSKFPLKETYLVAGCDECDECLINNADGGAAKCAKCSEKPAGNREIWTCPMHPEVESPKSGSCPKCGMALVKKKK